MLISPGVYDKPCLASLAINTILNMLENQKNIIADIMILETMEWKLV